MKTFNSLRHTILTTEAVSATLLPSKPATFDVTNDDFLGRVFQNNHERHRFISELEIDIMHELGGVRDVKSGMELTQSPAAYNFRMEAFLSNGDYFRIHLIEKSGSDGATRLSLTYASYKSGREKKTSNKFEIDDTKLNNADDLRKIIVKHIHQFYQEIEVASLR